jgi:hypothetical protein
MDERDGHKDLCGSGHQSIILYVHDGTGVVLLQSALSESTFLSPREEVSTRSFYSSRPGCYNEIRGPTDGPELVEILYNI